MIKTRPFLKWAGGKYNCLQHVIAALPEGHRFIEPFTGSGAVFMNAPYPSYLLAENNKDLVDLFNHLKNQGSSFIDYCARLFTPETNTAEHYYAVRAEFNQLRHSKRKSALFVYLNRHGYNGLCRYNATGGFNVPFGSYQKPYFPYDEMQRFSEKSQQAHFVHNDFRKTFLLANRPGDVVYCDPPYAPLTEQAHLFSYTAKKFTEKDQRDLALLAEQKASEGIPVILSNHDTAFTRSIYKNAEIIRFPVTRVINCQGSQRQPVYELLALFKN